MACRRCEKVVDDIIRLEHCRSGMRRALLSLAGGKAWNTAPLVAVSGSAEPELLVVSKVSVSSIHKGINTWCLQIIVRCLVHKV